MVRRAIERDLPQVAEVHTTCFPDSFSTALGEKLLVRFYSEYLLQVPELFLVAEENGKLCGFCMGYYCECNPYMKRFFKHNLITVGLRLTGLLLTGSKAAWRKLTETFFHKAEFFPIENANIHRREILEGDLLSICVLPHCQGKGVAQELISTYEHVLQSIGREACILTVAVDNHRAVHFYERNSYKPIREAPGMARTYYKMLH